MSKKIWKCPFDNETLELYPTVTSCKCPSCKSTFSIFKKTEDSPIRLYLEERGMITMTTIKAQAIIDLVEFANRPNVGRAYLINKLKRIGEMK